MDRKSILLEGLAKDARVIEIGPSYNPLVPKREGWNAFTVDHASREDLALKYGNDPVVDVSRIEDIDFIWTSGSIASAVPEDQHGTFDAFIASHVIEHTTDIVAFLKAAETLISPEGTVILALPDKRKCFDFYRHPSTLIDAIIANDESRFRHDKRTQFEYGMRMSNKDGEPGWSICDARKSTLTVPFEHAKGWLNLANRDAYVDAHNWVFVPASFELLVLELSAMGYLDLRIVRSEEAEITEFFAWLKKGAAALNAVDMQNHRCELMDRIIVELAEQSRQIAGSPLHEVSRPMKARRP